MTELTGTTLTGPCPRPDCDGTLEDDGYCDTCGRAAPAPTQPASQPASAAAASSATTAPTTGAGPPTEAAGPPTEATPDPAAGPLTAAGAPPSGPVSTPTVATPAGPSSPRSRSTRRHTSSRRHIGDGLVEIVAEPARDPADAILADPQVSERSRFCGACDAPVGRARDDRPGRTEGFCPNCGARFSFTPSLVTSDVLGNQYEVLGCLAHGGLGWVYLARDHNVRKRWVVLKGVLNTGDTAAQAAAEAEQDFIASLIHPKIVRAYNIVRGGEAEKFIVMEYLGGRSLRQMRDPREPMPPEQALAYVLEVLPALEHMHERELLYCDFKPDNVVQTGTDVTLIDLGAVRRIDDAVSDVYGTPGYQAPEIDTGRAGPTVASDVHTVGRTLAVLVANFDFHRTMRHRLPDPADAPALARHDPLRRLLQTATRTDPGERFVSISELADQMTGVLRQVVAVNGGEVPPRLSSCFGAPRGTAGTTVDAPPTLADLAATLPHPLPDPYDPATPAITAAEAVGPREVLAAVAAHDTDQARLSTALAYLRLHDTDAAAVTIGSYRVVGQWEWAWAGLLLAAATGQSEAARRHAEEVLDALPGELAPQVAMAVIDENDGHVADAGCRYARVWWTDRGWLPAAFGLARVRLAEGDRDGAIGVLDEVPAVSVHHADAQVASVRSLLRSDPDRACLLDAGRRAENAELDGQRRAELETQVLQTARDAGHDDPGTTLLGCPLDDRGLGFGLEERYRYRARFAEDLTERFALVDAANDARPWTRR